MGQRKKTHKFFRWMRQQSDDVQSDPLETAATSHETQPILRPPLPPIVTEQPHLSTASPDPNPFPLSSSLPSAAATSSTDPLTNATNPASKPLNSVASDNSVVILRVKELSAHQSNLRHIYVPATTNAPPVAATLTATTFSQSPALPNGRIYHTATPNATEHPSAASVEQQFCQTTAPSVLCRTRNANGKPDYLTERTASPNRQQIDPETHFEPRRTAAACDKSIRSLLKPTRPSSSPSARRTISATAFRLPTSRLRIAEEKSVSCRLYDCILPATCTARNASSEPPESRTPSILKLNLPLQQLQQREHYCGVTTISSSSTTSIIGRSAQLSKKRFLLDAMDRSVDSIGSCSLDVDAESTDFSDTSGSLNLCTPSSGKDFTREFTSRIHERCQLGQISLPPIQQQRTTTILDPASGKIKTILTSATVIGADDDNDDDTLHAVSSAVEKKPSYLNLACCVNGYSNLTTYDSKLRQNINRSREVSPIRPIIHTLQYNRGDSNGQYLVVPVPMPIINDTNSTANGVVNGQPHSQHHQHHNNSNVPQAAMNGDKRYFATAKNGSGAADQQPGAVDCTDFKSATSASPSAGALRRSDHAAAVAAESPKSFIQQRVERLYGPSALAAGFYSPKRNNGPATDGASILAERSQNAQHHQQHYNSTTTTTVQSSSRLFKTDNNHHNYSNGSASLRGNATENMDAPPLNTVQSLPVLRHLRPEFRAQLPIVSPKRSLAKGVESSTATSAAAATALSTSPNGKHSGSSTKHNGALHATTTSTTNNTTTTSKPHTNNASSSLSSSSSSSSLLSTTLVQRTARDVRGSTTATSPSSGSATAAAAAVTATAHHNDVDNRSSVVIIDNNANKSLAASNGAGSDHDEDEGDNASVNTVVRNMKITDAAPTVALSPKVVMAAHATATNGSCSAAVRAHATNGGSGADVIVPVAAEADVPTPAAYTNGGGNHKPATAPNGNGVSSAAAPTNGSATSPAGVAQKDGNFFLAIMQVERERLLALGATADGYLVDVSKLNEPAVDEEIVGNLRSAAGKARLLATQKIAQFEGLCHNNLNQTPDEKFPTTCDDLQGFWDMVMLQVDNVDAIFRDIERLRANNWQNLPDADQPNAPPTGSRITKRPMGRSNNRGSGANAVAAAAKKSAVAQAAAQRREEQRKQILELKRNAKKQQNQQELHDTLEDADGITVSVSHSASTTNGGSISNGGGGVESRTTTSS